MTFESPGATPPLAAAAASHGAAGPPAPSRAAESGRDEAYEARDAGADSVLAHVGEASHGPARSVLAHLPPAGPRWTLHYGEWAVLALILLLGAVFRFTGIDWDSQKQLHPDERFLTMVEGAIKVARVTQVAQGSPRFEPAGLLSVYFDSQHSGLNPHNVGFGFFVYGTFPLFAVHWLAGLLHATRYDQLGRILSGVSDLGTVLLVYLTGRRLYGARVGLLAAAFSAFCVMQIQQAHFFVFDSFLLTLVTAAFYYCVDIAQTGRTRSFVLAGTFLGLALATKLSMVVFAPIVALAALIYLWRTEIADRGLGPDTVTHLWRSGTLRRLVAGGALAALVAALLFRVFQPYAFAGPGFFDIRPNPKWLDNIAYQAKTQDGTVDLPPSIQWAGTQPLLFPWRHMVAWGLGIPLGLTVWAGFVAALAVVLLRGKWQHLLVAAWAGLCFVYFASVLNKTMRYVLPAYPFFILLGAWALVALYDWGRRERVGEGVGAYLGGAGARLGGLRRFAAPLALTLTGVVVVASLAWSWAFTRIYTRPTTRVAATQWIYQNVPKGSVMANEHWDDPLPVGLPGFDPGPYAGPQLPLYDPDEPRKIDTLVQMLSKSDYINVTSNRLYGSIPRIPQRYPMSTEYYKRLFAGDLGFKLVTTVTSYPQLGPWTIADDRAEEAFTVYDHPKVLIFQKQPDFSAERVRQILTAVPLDNVVQLTPVQVGKPNGLLPPALRQADTAGGTWTDEFSLEGIANTLAPVLWLLAVEVIGLLAAPLVWAACFRLPDRGLGLAKASGLLAVSWLGWTLAGYRLLPWTRLTMLLAVLALAAASALLLRRRGGELLAWVRTHRRLLVTSEAVFLAAFVAFTIVRMLNPDLWHPARGGEKPMEFSYLNAVIKTRYFPPYDPWFAGGYLNYYYFGYVLVAGLAKLTGVMPSIAFNLAVPTLYAFTAAGAFSFVYNLSRLGGRPGFSLRAALAAGLAGFALVGLVGNLDGFAQLADRLSYAAGMGRSIVGTVSGAVAVLLGGKQLAPFDFWRSSRIIPNNTINEFPFWTFLFADLHAHLISIPFQVLTLGWLLNLAYAGLHLNPASRPSPGRATVPSRLLYRVETGSEADLIRGPVQGGPLQWGWRLIGWRRLLEIAVTAWLLGALYVINTWEFPTYLLLAAAVFVIAEFTAQRGLTLGGLTRAAVSAAGAFLLAKPLFRPFWTWYVTFYSSVKPWTVDKTTLGDYLTIHGLFVFLIAALIVLLGWPRWRSTGWMRYLRARWRWMGAWERFGQLEDLFIADRRLPAPGYAVLWAAGGALVLGFLFRGLPLVAFLVAMLCATLAAAWERRESPALLLAALLAATGFALDIFVEFFTLQGDIGRMNTVFKFYLQVWVMWAVVSAAALAWAVDRIWASRWVLAPAAAAAPPLALPARGLLWENPVAAGAGDGDAADWPATPTPVPAVRRAASDDEYDSPDEPGYDEQVAVEDGGAQTRPRRRRARAAGGAQPAAWTLGLGWPQWAWLSAAAALVLATLAYPLGATPSRLADRFAPLPPTLDGMAYMQAATIQDTSAEVLANGNLGGISFAAAEDYDAIRWLLAHVHGSPVILEASIPEYRWGARVAKYTGLPAVLGWRWHQAQQRGTYAPQVDQRLRDVQTMFNDPSPNRVLPLLEKYQVRYIYVGDLERGYFSKNGLAKFDEMTDRVRPVYQQGGVTIYEVVATTNKGS